MHDNIITEELNKSTSCQCPPNPIEINFGKYKPGEVKATYVENIESV